MEQLTIEQLKTFVAFHKKLKQLVDKFDRDAKKFLGKFRYSKKKSKKCSRCRRTCIFGDDEGILQACRNYRKQKHINYKQYIKIRNL